MTAAAIRARVILLGALDACGNCLSLFRDVNATQDSSLETLFLSAGRNIAVAARFLPGAARREARAAYLVCRALDAFEDLSADAGAAHKGVRHVSAYICGRRNDPPSVAGLITRDEGDLLEKLIAERLPLIRCELLHLEDLAQRRIMGLAAEVAGAMIDGLRVRRESKQARVKNYGERVLGAVTKYAIGLTGLEIRWPLDVACIGRVAQAANDLRDVGKDALCSLRPISRDPLELRTRTILEALEAAPVIPGSLAALGGTRVARGRAAVSYMAATTAAFYVREMGYELPAWLRYPLATALHSLFSPRAFVRFCARLDDLVIALVKDVDVVSEFTCCPRRLPGLGQSSQVRWCLKRTFEHWLATLHPDRELGLVLHRGCRLAYLVMCTCEAVTTGTTLDNSEQSRRARSLVSIVDYLLSSAARELATLGGEVLGEFGRLLAKLAVRAASSAQTSEQAGEIAEFLAFAVGRARALEPDKLVYWRQKQRAYARYFGHVDVHGNWASRRRARGLLDTLINDRSPLEP